MTVWGTWFIETAWGWRYDADTPELLVAWDEDTFDENESGFREEIERVFANNEIRLETLRRARLKINGDAVMALYEPAEVDADLEPTS